MVGGADRDRTDDLVIANDALSQLSYSPSHSKYYNYRTNESRRDLHACSILL